MNSSKKNPSKPSADKSNLFRNIILVIIAVLLITLAGLLGYIYKLMHLPKQAEGVEMSQLKNVNISSETEEVMGGYWTIAIFGVDANELSDVIIICNIDRKTGEAKLASVYRDTYMKISQKKYYKINQAYCDGGVGQAIEALSTNLDMNFDDYITFDWKTVADAINLLGGIDLEITREEFRQINGYITQTVKATGVYSKHLTHDGMNHLDGVQAVAYARLRKMDTDFKRTERQRKVIDLALEKAKQADIATLNAVLVTVLPELTTSLEFTDLYPIAMNIKKYHIGETVGFPFTHSGIYMQKTNDTVIPENLERNVAALHEFFFGITDYQPSSVVKEISAKIEADVAAEKKRKQTKPAQTQPVETRESTEKTEVETGEVSSEEMGTDSPIRPTNLWETTQGGPGVETLPEVSEASGEYEAEVAESSNTASEGTEVTDENPGSIQTGPGLQPDSPVMNQPESVHEEIGIIIEPGPGGVGMP